MKTIETIGMATTITIEERTRKRLASYKRGDQTFDDVVNDLMDRVDLEDVAAEQIAEHHRALKEDKWIPASKVQSMIRRRLQARARRGR